MEELFIEPIQMLTLYFSSFLNCGFACSPQVLLSHAWNFISLPIIAVRNCGLKATHVIAIDPIRSLILFLTVFLFSLFCLRLIRKERWVLQSFTN